MTTTSRERHIQYAQLRRDNENEAREELECRLPEFNTELRERGDLTKSAKAMLYALTYLDPDIYTANPVSRSDFGGERRKEYAKLRRDNEVGIREALVKLIPEDLVNASELKRNDFNQTTKAVIAAAKYLDLLACSQRIEVIDDASLAVRRGTCLKNNKREVEATFTLSKHRLSDRSNLQTVNKMSEARRRSFRISSLQTTDTGNPSIVSPSRSFPPATEVDEFNLTNEDQKRQHDEDILADLRRDEEEQEEVFHGLNTVPPPTCRATQVFYTSSQAKPDKNSTKTSKRKSQARIVHPLDNKKQKRSTSPVSVSEKEKTDVTIIPELQALKSAVLRLTAKAEEAILAAGGLQENMKEVLTQAHDLVIDWTSVVEQNGSGKAGIKKKWVERKSELRDRGLEFQDE